MYQWPHCWQGSALQHNPKGKRGMYNIVGTVTGEATDVSNLSGAALGNIKVAKRRKKLTS